MSGYRLRMLVSIRAIVGTLVVCLSWVGLATPRMVAQTAHFSGAVNTLLQSGSVSPLGTAVDGKGNVYVTSGSSVLEIPAGCASTSCVTTLGGGFVSPMGVAVDASGNVYVADNGSPAVKEIPVGCASTSCVTTLGGGFSNPMGVAVDGGGNVFVTNNAPATVDEIPVGCTSGACVVPMMLSNLTSPSGLAVDGHDNLFVADFVNSVVTEIPAGCKSSSCTTSLGGGFSHAFGVAVDGSGNVYVADSYNNAVKEVPTGCASGSCVITLGSGFSNPTGVAVDHSEDVFVADQNNGAVKEIMQTGVNFLSQPVGTASSAVSVMFTFDSAGSIGAPKVLTLGAAGMDFADAGTGSCDTNGTSYSYTQGNTCTVDVTFNPKFAGLRTGGVELVGSAGAVIATAHIYGTGIAPQVVFGTSVVTLLGGGFQTPAGVAIDGSGNVYAADYGTNSVYEMPAGCASASCVTVLGGGFAQPTGVAVDGSGNVYVADFLNGAVKEMPARCASSSCVTPLGGGFTTPAEVALDGSGNIYVADTYGATVDEMPPGCASASCVTALGGGFKKPTGVAVDSSGNIYVSDSGNNAVYEMPAGCTSASCVSTLGGGFNQPNGVALDASGDVYVADNYNHAVKEIPPGCKSSSCVSTLNGSFVGPDGVALDGSGNVYVGDFAAGVVAEIARTAPPSLNFATTSVGVQSTDSPRAFTLQNIGNAALTLPAPASGANPSVATGFTVDSASTCPQVSSSSSSSGTLAAGASCSYAVDFIPTTGGTDNGSLVMTDDNLNAAAPTYATQTVSLAGTGVQITVLPAVLPAGTYGTAYGTTTFSATGGTGPYTFHVVGGSLPGGLGLNASGTLSGTPTSAGTFSFTVEAIDSSAPTAFSGEASETLQIDPAATTTSLMASSGSVNPGASVTLTATVSSAAGTPTGNVSFYDGTTLLGTEALSGGTASLSTTSLSAGTTHNITASYAGNADFAPSSTTASTAVIVAPLDFSISVSGSSSASVAKGGSASFQLVVAPTFGNYPGPVSFAASGAPAGSTVTFTPTTIPANGGQRTVVVTIQTSATTARLASPALWHGLAPVSLAFLLLPLFGVGRMRRQGRRLSKLVCLLLLIGGLAGAAGLVSGCGSGSSGASSTVTLTATSGSVQHSAVVTLDVK